MADGGEFGGGKDSHGVWERLADQASQFWNLYFFDQNGSALGRVAVSAANLQGLDDFGGIEGSLKALSNKICMNLCGLV